MIAKRFSVNGKVKLIINDGFGLGLWFQGRLEEGRGRDRWSLKVARWSLMAMAPNVLPDVKTDQFLY